MVPRGIFRLIYKGAVMKRRVGLLMMVGAMLPLGVASTAWACASLATLSMDKKVVAPGEEVTVTGRGFSDAHAGSTAGDSLVTLRTKARNGPIVAENVDVTNNRISQKVRMPTKSGFYVMLGTQTKQDGTAKAGTPARFAFRVSGAPAQQGAVASPWSGTPGGPASSASVAGDGGLNGQTLLVGGILSLTLIAAGSVLVGRKSPSMTLGV